MIPYPVRELVHNTLAMPGPLLDHEVSFTRHFQEPQPLRTLDEISADTLAIGEGAEGLLDGLLKMCAKP